MDRGEYNQHTANRKFAESKMSQAEAAAMGNVSERSITTAKKVQREGAEELISAVDEGRVKVSVAYGI